MSHRYDDEYERKRPASKTGLIVGITIAGAVFFGFLALVAGLVVWGGKKPPTVGHIPEVASGKTYTRAEFRKLVMGKTAEQVKAAVGVPSSTNEGDTVSWNYMSRTVDEVTGKTDFMALVTFGKDGRVEDVSF